MDGRARAARMRPTCPVRRTGLSGAREFDGQVFKDVAVRYKGNGTFMQSRGSLKRSLKVDLNKYVKGNYSYRKISDG